MIEPNKIVVHGDNKLNEETAKKNDFLKDKIVILESKIHSLKTEFDQKVKSKDEMLKIYEDKRKVNHIA